MQYVFKSRLCLSGCRTGFKDLLLYLSFEAHVNHSIRLIKDHVVTLIEDQVIVLNTVNNTTGRTNYNMHTLSELEPLFLDALTTHHAHCIKLRVFHKLVALLLDLLGELSGRGHDNSERTLVGDSIDVLAGQLQHVA